MEQRLHFIGAGVSPPASGLYVDVFDPATGRKIAEVAAGSAGDVDRAVSAASDAFAPWRDLRPIERGRILTEIARLMRERAAEFIALEAAETGKPAWQTPIEVERAAQYFEFFGGLVNVGHGEILNLGSEYHCYTRREPYGVVGVILPWNAPLNQAARAIAPAIAVGNTVVAKPSEETPGSLLALARLAVEACGLPPGVLNVVQGRGQEAGRPLIEHPQVRKVAFTGSLRAGQEIGRIAAERVLPLTLELGGKSANLVFEDADFDAAVAGAVRAFALNAGQICLAGTRLLVQRTIYERFVAAVVAAVEALKIGPEGEAFVGPLTTAAQFDKVQAYFAIAAEEGAVLETGGRALADDGPQDGWFVYPTVYSGVTTDMRIAREEIFGPVLVVMPFEDETHAVAIANGTDFGLAAGLWTRDLGRAHRVSALLEAGQIYVNEYHSGGIETPMGGYKSSGYGREKGVEALAHYTQLKCVTIRL